MNYYETLKIPETASSDEVKQAYRKLAKEFHPDKNPGDSSANQKFQEIQEAYSIRGDENKRQQYDAKFNGPNLEDLLNRFGFGSNFSNDFDMHFGGWRNNPHAKGQDVRVNITLTIEEIYTGATRSIDLGAGRFEVNIPKGARNGSKYKMTGKGQPNPFNSSAPHGDLILNINILYSATFILQGDDVVIESRVNFYDMVLGTNLDVTLPDNSRISVKVPPKTTPGKLLRVAGKGLPIPGTDIAGALIIKVVTDFQNLNEDQISLINKIKEISTDA